jgi:hypothetical protein
MTLAALPFTVTWPFFTLRYRLSNVFVIIVFELSLCSDCIILNTLLWWHLRVTAVGTSPGTILDAPRMFFATRPLYCAAIRNTDGEHASHYTPYLQYYLHEALFAQSASRWSIMGMSACLSLERLMTPICY